MSRVRCNTPPKPHTAYIPPLIIKHDHWSSCDASASAISQPLAHLRRRQRPWSAVLTSVHRLGHFGNFAGKSSTTTTVRDAIVSGHTSAASSSLSCIASQLLLHLGLSSAYSHSLLLNGVALFIFPFYNTLERYKESFSVSDVFLWTKTRETSSDIRRCSSEKQLRFSLYQRS